MKKFFKITLTMIALTLLMLIFWIAGMEIGNAIFPSALMEAAGESSSAGGMLWLFVVCFLNVAIILAYAFNSRIHGWRMVMNLFLIVFGIQFFMSQIETLWFNDALKMPINTIAALVTGGAIMCFGISVITVWLTGKFRTTAASNELDYKYQPKPLIIRILFLAIIVWPLVYFLAGYFIAWQFEDIRQYYSGSTGMDGLLVMMQENIRSGLFLFQVIRGFLWVAIAMIVLCSMGGSFVLRAIILGLLLSVIGSSQLLLPNSIMPEMVRLGHLIEISISNFIWGLLIAGFLGKPAGEKSFFPQGENLSRN